MKYGMLPIFESTTINNNNDKLMAIIIYSLLGEGFSHESENSE